MSNPGPAVTTSSHPQNVTSGQTLRLLGSALGVNAAATGDTAIPVINSTNFLAKELIVTNANNAGATANASGTILAVRTAPNAGGTSLFGAITLTPCTTPTGVSYNDASATTAAYANLTNLYARVTTASGNTATVDVYVYGYDFSQNQ